ncbi:MAG TPA: protoporphyrinogen oxidase [Gemmatimonadaceae bacterium]|nr:protoporphyrinogen oxidase [Gemmatimonadaceae bacterium]
MSGRHVIIVGGGITGLAAAEHLARTAPELEVTLLEADTRLGGCIGTERVDGYVLEEGPDLFVTAKPAALELAERLGLGERLHGTGAEARGSYILSGRRLVPLPEGLTGLVPSRMAPFAKTPLLSPLGKLRVGLDLLIPPRRGEADESVESFVVRRLGREMYERLVEPMLSGIFAGDGSRLSILAAFPQLRAFEREHGGMMRGMLAARRRAAASPVSAAPRVPGFVSLPTGMAELVEGATAALEAPQGLTDAPAVAIRRGARAVRLDLARGGLEPLSPFGSSEDAVRVVLADGAEITGDAVILATPAYVSAALLAPHDAALAAALRGIEYASTAVISLAYDARDVARTLDATGYTVPRAERRAVRACTWSSAKFEGRAPAGKALFRLFMGGAGREELLHRSDDALLELARAELRETMGIATLPELARVRRWERTMPQYTIGHLDRLAAMDRALAALPRVALAGNAYRGVGIPDCVRSGREAAERISATLAREGVRSIAA